MCFTLPSVVMHYIYRHVLSPYHINLSYSFYLQQFHRKSMSNYTLARDYLYMALYCKVCMTLASPLEPLA